MLGNTLLKWLAGGVLCLLVYARLAYLQEQNAELEKELVLLRTANERQAESLVRYERDRLAGEQKLLALAKEMQEAERRFRQKQKSLYMPKDKESKTWHEQKIPQEVLLLFHK